MKKTLILQYIDYGIFSFKNYHNEIYIRNLFQNNENFLLKLMRKIIFKLKLPFFKLFFSHWLDLINTVDTIIIFDNNYAPAVVNYLHKKYPEKRIIVWYWNVVSSTVSPNKFNRNYTELWSFDKEDCKKYNLNFNTQFFYKGETKRATERYQVLYVGVVKDRNRLEILNRIKQILDKNHITSNFYLVQGAEKYKDINYRPALKYAQVKDMISECQCILDITPKVQAGMSLRPLEALFFDKKLITNNRSILNSMLNKNNIFYYEDENVSGEKIKAFLSKTLDNSNSKYLKKYYSFDQWIKRFYK